MKIRAFNRSGFVVGMIVNTHTTREGEVLTYLNGKPEGRRWQLQIRPTGAVFERLNEDRTISEVWPEVAKCDEDGRGEIKVAGAVIQLLGFVAERQTKTEKGTLLTVWLLNVDGWPDEAKLDDLARTKKDRATGQAKRLPGGPAGVTPPAAATGSTEDDEALPAPQDQGI
jgi:hypothetical protein